MNFKEVPKSEWAILGGKNPPLKVYKNEKFLIQVRQDGDYIRLSINRIETVPGFPILWKDGITWDDLQGIKDAVGYADKWCMECYPPKDEIVNAANIRHLYVMNEVPKYGFFKGFDYGK